MPNEPIYAFRACPNMVALAEPVDKVQVAYVDDRKLSLPSLQLPSSQIRKRNAAFLRKGVPARETELTETWDFSTEPHCLK
jgi:hypothetical protein